MNCLYIAEKPSLGRAIAAALPKPHHNRDGYIEVGNGDCVTWCVGHLLEQCEPEAYDERYKRWQLDTLPIVVQQWQLRPRKGMSKQIAVVKKLVKQASCLVHAGDPDREGQLLVDELLDFIGLSKSRKQQVQRLLINDMNLPAVKKALAQLRSNLEFMPLSVSALARSRADWLYGMNMTRAFTLLGQQAGFGGVLSVGRVQTPVLGLVVRRDQQIADFRPQPFYQLDALVAHQQQQIRARWQPSDACSQWLDDEGRVLSRKLAEHVANRIDGQVAKVLSSEQRSSTETAPLPYSLSALQIDAAKRFGLSAQRVLSAAQKLYEQHKLITYPRSDCRYLPKGQLTDVPQVFSAIAAVAPDLAEAVTGANCGQQSRCWNDSKVTAHHAIIPTAKASGGVSLGSDERQVYQLVARQYLMQFYPAAEYQQNQLQFDIAGGVFIAKAKQLTKAGWRALVSDGKGKAQPYVPNLPKGSEHPCVGHEIKDCMTEPPKAFTEATLLQAMTGIGRFVKDPSLKAILRDTDGIGTEATRAGIIELLFKRQFLQRQGKSVHATEVGKALIAALPEHASYPDMTAQWEHQLAKIAERQLPYLQFVDGLNGDLGQLIGELKANPVPVSLKGLPAQPKRKFVKRKSRRTS
ncbi:DNA topoisomerase III [Ferrimonas senticii]|uniref:DNA topoisomerase III n=1 Tax=Ferrimonas senticii TaxID=394566 RepID=UPI00042743DE|nr:DNA topoisomerase III [Ferrimonas senticii]